MNKFLTIIFSLFIIVTQAQNPPEYDMSTMVVNDTIGILYDDGGKDLPYGPNRNYKFTITSSNGQPVTIKFEEFAMELNDVSQPGLCIYDYIQIYDGPDTVASNTDRYCGNSAPPEFTSTGASVTIHLVSDGGTEGPGFKMLWSTGTLPKTPVSYCEATGPACGDNFIQITEFNFNDFQNISSVCDENVGDPVFEDFTHIVIDYEVGTTINISGFLDGSLGTEVCDIYIDWNQDGDFEDNEEKITTANAAGDFTGAAVAPTNPSLGLTRLRVRSYDPVFGLGTVGPCGATDDGETEDYTLNVIDPAKPVPACATLLSPADLASNQCVDINFVWSAAANATAYDFRITTSSGAEVTEVTGLTDTTYTFEGLSPSTDYFWTVTATNDNGVSIGCSQFKFTTGVASPIVDFNSKAISICENSDYTFSANVTGGDGAYSYVWSGPAAVILSDANASLPVLVDKSIRAATDLYLQVSDARNCFSNVDTQSVSIKEVTLADDIELIDPISCFANEFKYIYKDGPYLYQESRDSITWTNYTANRLGGDTVVFSISEADTVYLRNISLANGCADTSDVVMQVVLPELEPASVDLFEGDLSNCVGTLVQLQANGYTDKITWSNGASSDTITVTETGSYSFVYQNEYSCQVFSDTLEIEIISLDDLTLNVGDSISICDGDSKLLITNNDMAVWNDLAATQNDSLVITESGEYFATVNIGNCRFSSDTVYLTVNPSVEKPSIDFELPNRICAELDSVEFGVTADFQWIVPANRTGSLTVFESGDFHGFVSNEFGCVAYSDTIDITFNSKPSKPLITQINDSLLVADVNETNTILWLLNGQIALNGVGEDSLVAKTNGNYQVLQISTAGCPSDVSDTYEFTVTGISEFGVFAQTVLYPNPNKGDFNITNLPHGKKQISMYNNQGKLVYSDSTSGKFYELHAALASGSYMLLVKQDDAVVRFKVIIQ